MDTKADSSLTGRLCEICSKARSDPNKMMGLAFAEAIGVDFKDYWLYIKGVGLTFELVESCRHEIGRCEIIGDKNFHLEPLAKITESLLCLRHTEKVRVNMLGKSEMDVPLSRLEVTANTLSGYSYGKGISVEERDKLIELIDEFWAEVISCESITERLREYLVDKLDMLRKAVQWYCISGDVAVRSAVDSLLGGVVTEASSGVYDLSSGSGASDMFGKVWKFSLAAISLMGAVNTTKKFAENLEELTSCLSWAGQ